MHGDSFRDGGGGSRYRGFLATTTLLIVLSVFAVEKDLGIVDTKGK